MLERPTLGSEVRVHHFNGLLSYGRVVANLDWRNHVAFVFVLEDGKYAPGPRQLAKVKGDGYIWENTGDLIEIVQRDGYTLDELERLVQEAAAQFNILVRQGQYSHQTILQRLRSEHLDVTFELVSHDGETLLQAHAPMPPGSPCPDGHSRFPVKLP